MYKQKNSTVFWILTLLLLFGTNNLLYGQSNENFSLVGTSNSSLADSIKQRVADVIHGINNHKSWTDFSMTGDNPAIGILNRLVDENEISTVRSAKYIYLLNNPDQSVEIRNLFVKTADTDTLQHKELLLYFNKEAQLIDAKLIPDKQNYQLALDREVEIFGTTKNRIHRLVENFGEGLTNKNSTVLNQLLDNDATIVSRSTNRHSVRYFSMSKTTYLQQLNEDLTPNGNVQMKSGQLKVYKHPLFDDVYAATFPQKWETNAYTDSSYLIMLFDMHPQPKLLLSTWKQHKPQTGYLKVEPTHVTDIAIPQTPITYDVNLKLQALSNNTYPHSSKKGFLEKKKRWIIISAATATAVGLGASLLLSGGETELPGPPGRPGAN